MLMEGCVINTAFFCLVQFRLVGKTALKLLLVFVEYTESNSRVLYDAIQTVDSNQGMERYLGKLIAVIMYSFLTKHKGRTGRISARGLDSTDLTVLGPYKKDQGPMFSQDGLEQAWIIRDLLHD